MNRYHWFVLIVAALGWLFDCLDQQLFNIARAPAMKDLLPEGLNPKAYGGYATSILPLIYTTRRKVGIRNPTSRLLTTRFSRYSAARPYSSA